MFKEIKKLKEIQEIIERKINKKISLKEIKAAVETGKTTDQIVNYFFFM